MYDKIVEALKQPNGEALMGMLGQLYGADTGYDGNAAPENVTPVKAS